MLIIVDKKMSTGAKANLKKHGEVFELATVGIVEESLSGHPDIFLCKTNHLLVVSPQVPPELMEKLVRHKITFKTGEAILEPRYPACAAYNAVATEKYLVHLLKSTDNAIKEATAHLKPVNVRQGFTRCSLLSLSNIFITSDKGIFAELQEEGCKVVYVNPEEIELQGHRHGFFGGCCGNFGDRVFVNGSLKNWQEGPIVEKFIGRIGFDIVELHSGPLVDCGSILFLE